MMNDIGRVCIKIAGKDAGKYCVVLEKIDDTYVLVDGEVARKRCNISHLKPLNIILKVKKNSDKQEIIDALSEEGIKIRVKHNVANEKKRAEKPVKESGKKAGKKTNAGKK